MTTVSPACEHAEGFISEVAAIIPRESYRKQDHTGATVAGCIHEQTKSDDD